MAEMLCNNYLCNNTILAKQPIKQFLLDKVTLLICIYIGGPCLSFDLYVLLVSQLAHQPVNQSVCYSVNQCVCLSGYLPILSTIYPFIHPSVLPSLHPSVNCLSIYLSVRLFIYLHSVVKCVIPLNSFIFRSNLCPY